jgi:acyl-CoA thioesterase-1
MNYLFFLKLLLAGLLMSTSMAHAEKIILVFGDSLSAGYGIARDASWPQLLQDEVTRTQTNYNVVNASVSAETTAGGVRRIQSLLEKHKPDIVIVELGANDGLRGSSLSIMRDNLSDIIVRAKRADAQVLLVGMKLPPNYGAPYVETFQSTFKKLAKQHRVTLLPFLLDGVTAAQFQADNLHPNADAQPQIMNNVLKSLTSMLTK